MAGVGGTTTREDEWRDAAASKLPGELTREAFTGGASASSRGAVSTVVASLAP